jgi:hypothetical protein
VSKGWVSAPPIPDPHFNEGVEGKAVPRRPFLFMSSYLYAFSERDRL